jgi:DNA-binding FrmR family transcriptional regulator
MTVIKDRKHKHDLVLRLKRIEGQLRGIQAMIESGADCEKVAQQISASRRALDKAFFNVISCAVEADPSAAKLLAKFG